MRGWIYVMSNPAMPGLLKVGKSGRDPLERASDLAGTGHPEKFVVEYDALVTGYHGIELATHKALCAYRYKGKGKATEFFTCTLATAVGTIKEIAKGSLLCENFPEQKRVVFEDARRVAEACVLSTRKLAEELRQREIEAIRSQEAQRQSVIEVAEAKRVRANWLADQESRLRSIGISRAGVATGSWAIKEGTLAICPSCNYINNFSAAFAGATKCGSCRRSYVVPRA